MKKTSISPGWRIAPAPVPDSAITREYSADVIVVGLGHAGTPAARAAAEAGASVIGIEKMERDHFGVFGRDWGHINSRFLAAKGVPRVDPLELFNEIMRRAGNRANPKLVMQFCRKSGEVFNWYTEPLTPEQMDLVIVEYWPSGKNFSGEISGQKFWPGTAQFDHASQASLLKVVLANQARAVQHGAQLHFGMEARQLVMTGDRVGGVVAQDPQGKYVKYLAAKGVILAAGDFGGNREMCRELLPDIVDMMDDGEDFSSFGRDGRGIQMAVWVGGRLEARPLAAMGGNNITLMGVIDSFGALWVDENGQRYCNEGFGDPVFAGFPSAQEKRGVRTIVFDSSIFEDLQSSPPAHTAFFINDAATEQRLRDSLAGARKGGAKGYHISPSPGHPGNSTLYAADSLAELADYIGFKDNVKENFLNTVKHYNEACAGGRDEDFGKDARLLHALDQPPFYAEPKTNSNIGFMLVTCGGLLTDEYQNVLNQKRDPIPGLYATGNCCGRRFGPQYSTPTAGVSIGMAITLGYQAGRVVGGSGL